MGHYGSAYVRVYLGGFTAQEFQFGDLTLDQAQYRLQRGERLLRLEKLPMELLILLVERRGGLVFPRGDRRAPLGQGRLPRCGSRH